MSKLINVFDKDENKEYHYEIFEDTIINHYSINSSSQVVIDLKKEGVSLNYYYHNINYSDNIFMIKVNHECSKTHSELYNHGVNVEQAKLTYNIDGIVPKKSCQCICNQENQIINLNNGKCSICPNLLIDNFDVDSNHAAYIGKFDEDLLFYLMSRGISRFQAINLLLHSFLLNSNTDINISDINDFVHEIEKICEEG